MSKNVQCPRCKKWSPLGDRSIVVGQTKLTFLQCGHAWETRVKIQTTTPIVEIPVVETPPTPPIIRHPAEDIISEDGKLLYHFQVESVKFGEAANYRCLFGHEMGLGKTVITLAELKLHKEELCPALIVCKASLKFQWLKEIVRWCGMDFPAQILEGKDSLIKLPVTIVSFDLLRNLNGRLKGRYKTVIIDECQLIKNTEAKRSKEVAALCEDTPHVMALSGTPIKNNASEYYSILHNLKPDRFHNEWAYIQRYVDSFWDGYKMKYAGLKNPERFHNDTKDFILRYERKEVMPELPNVSRNFRYSDLGAQVELAYNDRLEQFQEEYGDGTQIGGKETWSNLMGHIAELRHITGRAKVLPTRDFVEEFLDDNERKLTLFVHHIDVGSLLSMQIDELLAERGLLPCLQFSGSLPSEARQAMIEEFQRDDKRRVMVASTLAGGEGINLQFCSDCVLVERQWNPANEEQAECRFVRIGQTSEKVSATYAIAVGTIDEMFAELVEKKRQWVKQTLGDDHVQWEESTLIRELMDLLSKSGKRKWAMA